MGARHGPQTPKPAGRLGGAVALLFNPTVSSSGTTAGPGPGRPTGSLPLQNCSEPGRYGVVVANLHRPARFCVSPWSPVHVFAVGGKPDPAPLESSWQSWCRLALMWLSRIWLFVELTSTRIPSVVSPAAVPLFWM